MAGRALLLSAVLLIAAVCAHAEEAESVPKPQVIAPNALRTRAEAEKAALKAAGKITPEQMKITPDQLKETIEKNKGRTGTVRLNASESSKPMMAEPAAVPIRPAVAHHYRPRPMPPRVDRLEDMSDSQTSRAYIRARAASLTGQALPMENAPPAHAMGPAHWAYDGEAGPQAWGHLQPEFSLCSNGLRQSPINIEDGNTLMGPAEPLQISYRPSGGTVVNNGHTIQVNIERGNLLTIRGTTYEMVQFHFHHPSEERINFRSYEMVAHLVHKSADGQLAVLAVLIEPGAASDVLQKVFTYMPLEVGDQVNLPAAFIDLSQLLPQDMRYYQFLGSLTTPPCSEGVLWMILKQPVSASREQLHMFSQLFPNNARPTQPANGRIVRNAQ